MLTAINSGDTAWMLISTALTFLMVPGFALFYGSPARNKNGLSILMPCMTLVCLMALQWVLFGYSLSFGPDHGGWIGTLARVGLRGVTLEPNLEYSGTIPHQTFMIYQGGLALLAPAMILGVFGDRLKFSAFCLFALLWTTFVYDPVAHWIWGVGGFLRNAGALDWAGGTVIHINAGIAILVMALFLRKHPDNSSDPMSPSDLPLAGVGTWLLWFGWLGYTAGGALSSGNLSTNAFVATYIAAAFAGFTWMIMGGILGKRPTHLGMLTGVIAGLTAITPAAGFVTIWGAIGIGVGVSVIGYSALAAAKNKWGWDDSFDAFGVHGIGGAWGMLATGLWATKSINSNGSNGLFYGNPAQFVIQIKTMLATVIYSFLVSWGLFQIVDRLVGLRVSEPASSLRQ